jgi:FkbM family methyltransferase
LISKFKQSVNIILKSIGLKIVFLKDYNKILKNINTLNQDSIFVESYINDLMHENISEIDIKEIISTISQKQFPVPKHINSFQIILDEKKDLTFFDVGAHRGETINEYKYYFPNVNLYSFEPFIESFNDLEKVSKLYSKSQVFNIGLSNFNGMGKFYNHIQKDDRYFSLINSTSKMLPNSMKKFGYKDPDEIVQVECKFSTLDYFLDNEKIEFIDLLKIDVQGGEYKVLEGAENTISSGKIKIIFLEILISPIYEDQKNLSYYLSYFEKKNYELFGLYNLSYQNDSSLLQFDAMFVRK